MTKVLCVALLVLFACGCATSGDFGGVALHWASVPPGVWEVNLSVEKIHYDMMFDATAAIKWAMSVATIGL